MHDDSWLEDFLPLMRCPDTHQPLRRATADECAKNNVTSALATQDGSRIFIIDEGIPILLPGQ
ncbi:hypothetical protein [Prosthecobacter sp.]|uniref:hypothetical protein n=1 Tax=Prosthecobacter sp. TaxID=1965333 RepID=UPI002AB9AE81|nr:hypothetical protein [Prosthecobacter sp.]MDZ4404930.1 hypothetical protein [Prosthecobacter sp.]